MNWNYITSIENLNQLHEVSNTKSILIFKHSTACNISSMVLNRIESKWKNEYSESIIPYYLDLISYKSISNEISNRYQVIHESPQVLIIRNGISVYDESHNGIRMDEILENLKS